MVNLRCEFPPNFFEEEEKCGYIISAQMKKVWAVELDLLNEFSRVCHKHSIPFYICDGTLLGAVRHKGMIPWDDDIDVMMFRKDYEKLCEIGSKEFKYPYFFQTEYTDKGALRGHVQIRNSETTAILKSELNLKRDFNQGIFLDVFPMDNVPDDKNERCKYLQRAKKLYVRYRKKAARGAYYKFRFRKNLLMMAYEFLIHMLYQIYPFFSYFDYEQAYEEYELFSKSYNNVDTKDIIIAPFYKQIRKRLWFNDIIYLPFEFLSLPAPSMYDDVLKNTYGNYHKYVIGTSLHGGIMFDTEKSYKEYLK